MSGLEGLVALGLACSIFQTVSFGRETLVLIKDVYRNGTTDESLMEKSTAIQEVASDIITVEIPRPFGKYEQKLFDVTKKCTGVARDLKEEIAFLMGHDTRGSLRATLKTTVEVNWRKRRLERMERDLADSEQLMQSTLLAWIFKTLNTASMNIDCLEERVRHFVFKYEQGHRQTSELVSKEALQVREAIIRESGKTEVVIRDHVTQTSAKFEQGFKDHITQANRERLREKLLNSLKYPGMNERANQIENPHNRTFRWLFADQDNLSRSNEEPNSDKSQDMDVDDGSSEESGYSGSFYESYDECDENGRLDMVWSSFTDWLQSNLNLYWIMGKPGSGKSTLAKFILSEPRTETLLEQWRRDAITASHYFWRPGTLMQRNIKGMLCSIAYQLVLAIPNALQYASLNFESLDQKDSDTDWAVPELQRLCLGLIRHCGKPLCLLIDGLDECGPEDDHQRLLDILESFKSHDVKIIASSRNEPVFERRFRHQPQLRMQDLTAGDLSSYARDKLRHEIRKDDFIFLNLPREAEGVFLWLVLAVQSLNRGFGNGDSLTDLRERMETLPERLNELYKDMWNRLNDDAEIYRRSAALYFRLVMAVRDECRGLRCVGDRLSIMEMMFASSEMSHDAFKESHSFSTTQWLEKCERFRENVEVRCAGLLVPSRSSMDIEQAGLGDTEQALLDYARKDLGFQFIHRSARDFMFGTTDGQSILRYDGISSKDLNLCVFSAVLRAVEVKHLIRQNAKKPQGLTSPWKQNDVEIYLSDLSRLAEGRNTAVETLFSRCFDLYSSSVLRIYMNYYEMRPARIAAFFGIAAYRPNLDCYSTNMIEKRFAGRDIRTAILLAIVVFGLRESSLQIDKTMLSPTLARWLLRLCEVDINRASPLVAFRPFKEFRPRPTIYTCNPDEIGPLDNIKASLFTRLLGSGLVNLDWKPMRSIRSQTQVTRFLQLVCDFVYSGGDLRSTVFLACPDHWFPGLRSSWEPPGLKSPSLLQLPGWDFFNNRSSEDDDRVLCVVALEAVAVIQRIIGSLLQTDRDSSGDTENRSRGDIVGVSDLEAAVSFLAQRCQEYGHRPEARVVGLLQPCGNFADMPYRLVSHHDSVNLINDVWKYMDVSENGVCWDNLEAQLREVVARSPFSCIGFRDYLREHGHFDELSAHTLLADCEYGT